MPALALLVDGVVVNRFPLAAGELLIGRQPGCDIQIDDTSVSSRHALLTVRPSRYLEGQTEIVIEDLNSTNGTFVNDRRVERQALAANDTVRIAWNTFRLVDEDAPDFERTAVILPEAQ